MNKLSLIALTFLISLSITAQSDRWQQAVHYKMDIDLNTKKHQYSGKQVLEYTNNSPDELNSVFYHLFFNAFQPESMMDVRSRTILDPDDRVGDRIYNLPKDEQGWINVKTLTMNGVSVDFQTVGTILEVQLATPIAPNSTVTFEMEWDAQVPTQIRRSGWMNKEDIEYTMTQWYPKMCEYDYKGWHAYSYVGREFYGIWGDFEVNITAPSDYILAFSGILQNKNEIGYGYGDIEPKKRKKTLTWKIKAENVHDFAWCADPDFIHETATMNNGTVLHFIHQDNEEFNQNWKDAQKHMVRAFQYMNDRFGKYPYEKYTFAQGGDGGMEYPMITMITGQRNLKSLVGVSVHEGAHSWYQGVLASNEMLHSWMDEGFTSFATSETMNYLFPSENGNVHKRAYASYFNIVHKGYEERLETPSDMFKTNWAYGVASYSKGETFITQLGYVIGNENRDQGLLNYFEEWKFKHPNPNDLIRVMEKQSNLELDWYLHYFGNTTDTIDYAIQEVIEENGKTKITLKNVGTMPMPMDIKIIYQDNTKEIVYIPLRIMRGKKPNEFETERRTLEDWAWTNPTYTFTLDAELKDIRVIQIDPNKEMADVNRSNNRFEQERKKLQMIGKKDNNKKATE